MGIKANKQQQVKDIKTGDEIMRKFKEILEFSDAWKERFWQNSHIEYGKLELCKSSYETGHIHFDSEVVFEVMDDDWEYGENGMPQKAMSEFRKLYKKLL